MEGRGRGRYRSFRHVAVDVARWPLLAWKQQICHGVLRAIVVPAAQIPGEKQQAHATPCPTGQVITHCRGPFMP